MQINFCDHLTVYIIGETKSPGGYNRNEDRQVKMRTYVVELLILLAAFFLTMMALLSANLTYSL
jgi:hypothetical protein